MTKSNITSVNESIDRILDTVKGLSEETIRWNPTADEWSIMQIMAHIVEALPYWVDEIEQLVETPGKQWGRNHLHEPRLQAVKPETVDAISVEEIVKELQQVKQTVQAGIENLTAEQLAAEATSVNPNFGTKPLSFIIDHLIDQHVNKHEGQIQRNLSKLSK
ncbi:putative damage-inducible protein DinB [Psychrobacillus insolitus]|uniref:Putative damage-inducible protein DinB n=1 Tax=Psychrobacillus insolitus TaxID=1461 RepID=A0A2W7MJJ8_9BACI|nr:DinB family protein [Psychrobacillus insolitus]PZX07452.1 putative damage-inducible protein DinB [Psychrobacillus insolitus]